MNSPQTRSCPLSRLPSINIHMAKFYWHKQRQKAALKASRTTFGEAKHKVYTVQTGRAGRQQGRMDEDSPTQISHSSHSFKEVTAAHAPQKASNRKGTAAGTFAIDKGLQMLGKLGDYWFCCNQILINDCTTST